MREIKFRAWDKADKHFWNTQKLIIRADGRCWHRFCNEVTDEIELMQYTGLKDKNGKEIYEGDIVKSNQGSVISLGCGKVFFDCGCFWWQSPKAGRIVFSGYEHEHLEVIGNIYENKELLE